MAEENFIHFRRNVNYTIGIRFFPGDRDGAVLNHDRPVIAVAADKLRDFRYANKDAIDAGLIKEVEADVVVWESANAVDDNEVQELLKSYAKLKKTLATLDSLPILYKIRDAANTKGSNKQTLSVIANRIAELEPDEEPVSRDDMKGSKD